MQKSNISVKVIMPSELVFEARASSVNIPGGEGIFSVLPGHTKLVSTIKTGVVSIFATSQAAVGKEEKKFFIYDGIVRVTGMEVNIVSEFAVNLEDQKQSEIRDKIAALKAETANINEKDTIKASILYNSINQYETLLKFVNNLR